MGNIFAGAKPVPPKTRFDLLSKFKPIKEDETVSCMKKAVNTVKYVVKYILYVISLIPLAPTAVVLTAYDKTCEFAKNYIKPRTDKGLTYVKETANKYPRITNTLKYGGLAAVLAATGAGAYYYAWPAVSVLI